jgi:hypothetical protein
MPIKWWILFLATIYAVYQIKNNSSQYPTSLAVAIDMGWVAGTLLYLNAKLQKVKQTDLAE